MALFLRGRQRDLESSVTHERDYLERTIATVRNHRDADNCWPQWANIFADEIERLWAVEEQTRDFCSRPPEVEALRERLAEMTRMIHGLLGRASREPLEVDISDYSDEWCAGFLAGQANALEVLARQEDEDWTGYHEFRKRTDPPPYGQGMPT